MARHDEWQEGFDAGYERGYVAGRLSLREPKFQREGFVVTEADQSKYPDLNLPMGEEIRLVYDLSGQPIGYVERT